MEFSPFVPVCRRRTAGLGLTLGTGVGKERAVYTTISISGKKRDQTVVDELEPGLRNLPHAVWATHAYRWIQRFGARRRVTMLHVEKMPAAFRDWLPNLSNSGFVFWREWTASRGNASPGGDRGVRDLVSYGGAEGGIPACIFSLVASSRVVCYRNRTRRLEIVFICYLIVVVTPPTHRFISRSHSACMVEARRHGNDPLL